MNVVNVTIKKKKKDNPVLPLCTELPLPVSLMLSWLCTLLCTSSLAVGAFEYVSRTTYGGGALH